MSSNGRFWIKPTRREHAGPDRAFLLCRQSLTRNQSISLDDQERHNRAYAEQQGYEVVRVHKSANVKGWREERADHDLLRQLAAGREIEVVVSYDVSRTARTVRILEVLAHDLERHGVRLEFAAQPFANTPQGRQMLGMFAELETAHRSVRLRDAWDTLRRMGRWHGAAPYGYRRAARAIAPEPSEDEIARRILRLPFAGLGSVAIRDLLTAEGVPTRTGAAWSESLISRMLRNPAYAGGMVIDGETVWPPDGEQWHEPLIPRDEWEALQAILPSFPHVRSKAVASWLEGLTRHACGARMYLVGTADPRGDLLPLFRCQRRYQAHRCRVVHAEVSSRNLETAARTAFVAAIAARRDPDEVLREAAAAARLDGSRDARRAIAKRRQRLLTRRANALDARLDGTIDKAAWRVEDDRIAAALAALDDEEAALPGGIDADAIHALAGTIAATADLIADASPERIALAMRALGLVAVVGEGGVRMDIPPQLAPLLAVPAPVPIPRARTRARAPR